jgi:hypothetical protein
MGVYSFTTAKPPLQTHLHTYMQKVRSNEAPPAPERLYKNEQPRKMLMFLERYCSDTIVDVRRKAYYLAYRTGTENETGSQNAVNRLITGLSDKNSGIVGSLLDYLQAFHASAFNDTARSRLSEMVKQGIPHYKKLLKLVGFLDLPDAQQVLRQKLRTNDYSTVSERWTINLALARMGDQNAIDFCLSTAKKMPVGDDFIYEIAPDLVYTRQKELVDYLVPILFSDKKHCSSPNPASGSSIRCGYRIMEYLAPVIKNFPLKTDVAGEIKTDDYTKALKKARKWLKKHREDYEMVKNRF